MKDMILDVVDFITYDILKKPLPQPPDFSLNHKFIYSKSKEGRHVVESKNYPGLIAVGDTKEELRSALFDTILTYFDVPRAYAKRTPDILELNLPDGDTIYPPQNEAGVIEAEVNLTGLKTGSFIKNLYLIIYKG